jgi:hypothetical protein
VAPLSACECVDDYSVGNDNIHPTRNQGKRQGLTRHQDANHKTEAVGQATSRDLDQPENSSR